MHLSTRTLANENGENLYRTLREQQFASANSRAEKDVRESGSDGKNIRGDRL